MEHNPNLPWYRQLHWQVLAAMVVGAIVGLVVGQFFFEHRRRDQRVGSGDSQIVGLHSRTSVCLWRVNDDFLVAGTAGRPVFGLAVHLAPAWRDVENGPLLA